MAFVRRVNKYGLMVSVDLFTEKIVKRLTSKSDVPQKVRKKNFFEFVSV